MANWLIRPKILNIIRPNGNLGYKAEIFLGTKFKYKTKEHPGPINRSQAQSIVSSNIRNKDQLLHKIETTSYSTNLR